MDFRTGPGKQQLADYKKRALNKVIDDHLLKSLLPSIKFQLR